MGDPWWNTDFSNRKLFIQEALMTYV